MSVDIVIINADVQALDEARDSFSAVGIDDGKIAFLGSDKAAKKIANSKTRVIDARGRVVLPGFIDAHTHFAYMGVREGYLDLSDTASKHEALARIKKFALCKDAGQWVIGSGWDESHWSDSNEYMNKEELDAVAPDNPVLLRRVDGHLDCVNTRALKILNLPVDTVGYEVVDGEPTGVLKEDAVEAAAELLEPSADEFASGITAATKIAHRLGVTSIQDAQVDGRMLKAYRSLNQAGELNIRASLMLTTDYLDELATLGLGAGFGDDMLQLGPIKVFSDGSIGAGTAAISEPYLDNPRELGLLMWEKGDLERIVLKAHKSDIQLAVHAIGDRAIDLVLDCFERANSQQMKDLRHRIEHAEMLSDEQIARMKKLNIIASMQPNFVGQWGLAGGMYDHRLGRERTMRMNPFASVIENGVPLVFGSDCMPFDPLYGIHSAVNAPYPLQRISPEQALRAYTIGGAYASFEDAKKGTLEVGKLADLVMLDGNPFNEPQGIKDMSVEMTILDGKIVYEKS
ncbi:amidohydrolase [Candidatus Bipolaricaulota bacterium]|nr:amidohydrolase [Candidatus Bipolaricaulota bacterium]